MSRSRKKRSVVTVSGQIDKKRAHKTVRTKVKAELKKDEPDLCIIEADTREMLLEEQGTKIDWEFDDKEGVEKRK